MVVGQFPIIILPMGASNVRVWRRRKTASEKILKDSQRLFRLSNWR